MSGMSRMTGLLPLLLAIVVVISAPAALAANHSDSSRRPRICLVLGGGGARGGAHVGVLEALRKLRVPVDCVVGTSMGAIVGGLYASGMSPDQIAREVRSLDWGQVFTDAPSRADLAFRRKEEDYTYAFKFKAGLNRGGIQFPLALIRGQKFDLALNRLLLPVITVKNFDDLPIPFRAVATDIATGQAVVLGSGNLTRSIHASMAVPAVFDPVEIDGRALVDGGISDNLPIDVARKMGADVVIAVDVGSGLYRQEEIKSILGVTGQLVNYLFTLNTQRQLEALTPRDVVIRPQLGNITGTSFDRVNQTIAMGREATESESDALSRYSLSPRDYADYLARHAPPQQKTPVIDAVRIENHSGVGDSLIADRITAKPGHLLDVKKLDTDIGRVYGLDIFTSVRYDVVREDDKNTLLVIDKDKQWGPGYLQFGLTSLNNLKGNSTFKAGLLYTRTELNKLNGEWLVALQMGDAPSIGTQLYQPLDSLSRYFVSGSVGYGNRNLNVFDQSGNLIQVYQQHAYHVQASVGREFGTWGQAMIGYRRQHGSANVTAGMPGPNIDIDNGEFFVTLADDTLDSIGFPSTGHYVRAEYRLDRERFGSGSNYNQALLLYTQAFQWRQNILLTRLYGLSTVSGTSPFEQEARLGGFLRLSGLQEGQLTGQYAGYASLVYMYRIIHYRYFQSYLGASLERGNVWQNRSDVSYGNAITSGSVFFGMATPIGPIYFAFGHANTGENSFYIALGSRFGL